VTAVGDSEVLRRGKVDLEGKGKFKGGSHGVN
jgi:hypothetical protein